MQYQKLKSVKSQRSIRRGGLADIIMVDSLIFIFKTTRFKKKTYQRIFLITSQSKYTVIKTMF